ncbi:translation elongation factor Ts [Euzebya tangerina]|uniref:translation elongation factor Ts n=1 Tax=Euzebya tangerina TaxID=591198 RepID=UPI000E322CB5|nr:translation elongation factor Ts [Euzebya tangerina]
MSDTKISAADVKALREATGAGMMACKKALVEADGDMEAAADIVRKTTGLKMEQRAGDRTAAEGLVHAYLHTPTPGVPAKVGVMLQLNCETDFVAKEESFQQLAQDIALHIAASKPVAVSEDQVDPALIEKERAFAKSQAEEEGKPENIVSKIVEGRVAAMLKDQVLLNQPFVKNPDQTIAQLITDASARTGEKIEVGRFVRFQIG